MRALSLVVFLILTPLSIAQTNLPGTKPLTIKGDIAARMVEGIDRYLNKKLKESLTNRKKYWQLDFTSKKAYEASIRKNRQRFRKIIGVVDKRLSVPALEFQQTTNQSALVGKTKNVKVYAVRWPVLPGMFGEGLLLKPTGKVKACAVAIPDADMEPEVIAGLQESENPNAAFALTLARKGCLVVVPTLIDRSDTWSGNPKIGRMTNQPHREFVYRMAYQMGRHVIGYEVQKVLAAVDWFSRKKKGLPICVCGYGEGGLLALYSGAADTRISVVGVSGYFGIRQEVWREPIYRNVWSLLRDFGDAELAGLIAPHPLVIEDHPGPKIDGPPPVRKGRRGAAPGGIMHRHENGTGAEQEIQRAFKTFYEPLKAGRFPVLVKTSGKENAWGSNSWLQQLFINMKIVPTKNEIKPMQNLRPNFKLQERRKRQFDQAVNYTQNLLPTAVHRRDEFWKEMDTSSLAKWKKSTQKYRGYFHDEIIGKLPPSKTPLNVRTRLAYKTPKWKGYEVVLDLNEDIICYGILLVPNDIKPGEKRPVVVCQHGLEGRPQDVVNPKEITRAYRSFGAKLADLGFVVFAPQNPYIGRDRFRVLNRKGNPLKLSLYSFIVAQNDRILDWLETLPFVDPARIGYYGLSYGGKTAMRLGALLGRYCVVVCSGDFNEWIWKNITLLWRNSYMFTGEYEMYEFNMGYTYNYGELARLIAPRPFMVERGHDDGVGLDEWVAHEYARVRRIYSRLGIADRTEIEFFPGGHVINGQGTFRFLRRHLNWPEIDQPQH